MIIGFTKSVQLKKNISAVSWLGDIDSDKMHIIFLFYSLKDFLFHQNKQLHFWIAKRMQK